VVQTDRDFSPKWQLRLRQTKPNTVARRAIVAAIALASTSGRLPASSGLSGAGAVVLLNGRSARSASVASAFRRGVVRFLH
jgi:hypothetical protein